MVQEAALGRRADDGRRRERGAGAQRPGHLAPGPGLAGARAQGAAPTQARVRRVPRQPHRRAPDRMS